MADAWPPSLLYKLDPEQIAGGLPKRQLSVIILMSAGCFVSRALLHTNYLTFKGGAAVPVESDISCHHCFDKHMMSCSCTLVTQSCLQAQTMFFFFYVTGVYLTSRTITDPTKGGAIVMTKKEGKYVTHLSPRTNTYLGILYARQFWEVTHDVVCLGDSISTWRLQNWFIVVICFVGVHCVVLRFKLHEGKIILVFRPNSSLSIFTWHAVF